MMKILVFGMTGQVATELQKQCDVVALGRDQADLYDPNSCTDIIHSSDADVIINAAAYTAVDKAESEEALANIINGDAPTAMARAAASRSVPFLHISTDYVFDGAGTKARTVEDVVAPANAYGRTKLAGEEGVRASLGQWAILRTSWVFSAHRNNFVKTMLRLSETRKEISVVSDQIGGPTAAHDIASTLLIMAQQMVDGAKGGIYHFSGGPHVSWAEFAEEIFSQAGRDVRVSGIPTAEYPTPAKRPLNSRMDCSAIKQDFGISAPDWRTSLSKVLAELEHETKYR